MKTVQLEYPIKIDNKLLRELCDEIKSDPRDLDIERDGENSIIKSLTFNRLKAKHLKLIPKEMLADDSDDVSNPEDILPIIAALANVHEKVLDELDITDLKNVAPVLSDFLDVSPKTGKS